jgi:bacterioferritin
VDDPHIKRVLHREAWESEYHARKFQRILDKMTPEQAEGLPGEENELPEEFVERLQGLVASKYTFAPPGCSSRNPSLAGSSWISP